MCALLHFVLFLHKLSSLIPRYIETNWIIATLHFSDCACGDVCQDGSCQAGCQVYDVFIREGRERTVYGRRCQCGVDTDADGRPILVCYTSCFFLFFLLLLFWQCQIQHLFPFPPLHSVLITSISTYTQNEFQCAEGVTFENNPYQVPMFESNPACAAPPVIEEVPVEVLDASPAAAEATTAAAPEATTAAAK